MELGLFQPSWEKQVSKTEKISANEPSWGFLQTPQNLGFFPEKIENCWKLTEMDSLIGHCAVSSNNLDSRFVKLSAIVVIAQIILERLYLASGLSQFAPRGNVPMYPHPHRTIAGYFSILVPFFRMWPSIFWSTRFAKYSGRVPVPSAHTISSQNAAERWRSGRKQVAPQ